ncbi:hypothetical protein TorRG33x02_124920, partial [Trema orientale]
RRPEVRDAMMEEVNRRDEIAQYITSTGRYDDAIDSCAPSLTIGANSLIP